MLHTKYYEILKQFLGDYNREIYGRELIGKVKMSQKGIALALEELEKISILKSRKHGSFRYFRLNKDYTEIKDVIVIAELMRKNEFLAKHRKIAYTFKEDERIVGLFGSYAKGTQKEGSDIDLFIIGQKKEEDYNALGKRFSLDISIKYFSKSVWTKLAKEKNNLCQEIIKNHVIIFNAERFIELILGAYYGFH